MFYDYSLLLLAQKISLTKYIRPIALPATPDQDYSGMMLLTSGWGNTRIEKSSWDDSLMMRAPSDVPKKAILKAVVHNAMRCRNQGFEALCEHCGRSEVLCTYGKKHFNRTIVEDACTGDSGGTNLISYVFKYIWILYISTVHYID